MIKLDNTLRRTIKMEAKMKIFSRLPVCVLAVAVYMLPAVFIGTMTALPLDAGLMRIIRMLLINLVCEIVILGSDHAGHAVLFRWHCAWRDARDCKFICTAGQHPGDIPGHSHDAVHACAYAAAGHPTHGRV